MSDERGPYNSLSNGSLIKMVVSLSSRSTENLSNLSGFKDLLKGEKNEGENKEPYENSFPFVGGGLGRSAD
jgi:hypothetical protein